MARKRIYEGVRIETLDAEREERELALARVAFEAEAGVEPQSADDMWRFCSLDDKRRYRRLARAVEQDVVARYRAALGRAVRMLKRWKEGTT